MIHSDLKVVFGFWIPSTRPPEMRSDSVERVAVKIVLARSRIESTASTITVDRARQVLVFAYRRRQQEHG